MADEAARASSLEGDIAARTDVYFNRTREVVRRFGDRRVTYAVFLRRPVIAAPRLMLEWIALAGEMRGTAFEIDADPPRGQLDRRRRADRLHQRQLHRTLRPGDDHAAKARPRLRRRAQRLPDEPRAAAGRLPGDGGAPLRRRRDAGDDGLRRRASAARRPSARAPSASSATPTTAPRTGSARLRGRGTMPHSLIGYAGSTVRAAEMFLETFPEREPDRAGRLFRPRDHRTGSRCAGAFRSSPPTGGSRCGSTRMAGASSKGSIRPRAMRCWSGTRRARSAATAATRSCATSSAPASPPPRSGACARRWTMPASARCASSPRSGFGVDKCRVMADARAPIDIVGTGSFIPDQWSETYATADIVEYDGAADGQGRPRVPAAAQRRAPARLSGGYAKTAGQRLPGRRCSRRLQASGRGVAAVVPIAGTRGILRADPAIAGIAGPRGRLGKAAVLMRVGGAGGELRSVLGGARTTSEPAPSTTFPWAGRRRRRARRTAPPWPRPARPGRWQMA